MKRTNIIYWILPPLGLLLAYVFLGDATQPVAFYGFAETAQTSINYREPLLIEEILVQPGAAVVADEPLLRGTVVRDPDGAVRQPYDIAELRAKERVWRAGLDDELRVLTARQQTAEREAEEAVTEARQRLDFQRSLREGLRTPLPSTGYPALEAELASATRHLEELRERHRRERAQLTNRRERARSPYRETIRRLEAEREFAQDRLRNTVTLRAPLAGLVGNIHCRPTENVKAYAPLLDFYEPHPSVVRGYVHEDLRLRVAVGDRFEVASLVVPGNTIVGTVTGLGSRIVEIPARLRKLPELRSYGREVTVAIPSDNGLLQKEKVSLRHLGSAVAPPAPEALK